MRLLLLLPFIVACSALPMDGSALGALRGEPEEACTCEVEVTCG